jgi:EAL domain-containing protein (putative c-di-GMP-specific phosphodiesterase class I)
MRLRLSIDDFGTGYSSLSYLRHSPVYKLKIDRLFVQAMTADPDDAAITGTIILMGRSLNLKVIAEGVENEV